MAQITKRGDRWQARVRMRGISQSASFSRKVEAAAWAAQAEADIAAGRLGKAPDRSFGELLEKYRDEVSEHKDGARWERIRINAMESDPLWKVRLPALSQQHFAAWRDRRMAKVSAATVRREWNMLASICTRAVKEWHWLPAHPMRGVSLPPDAPPRTRRIPDDEIERILHACGYLRDEKPETDQAMVGAVFLFAIETAMRAGEICALMWADVDLVRRVAVVRAEVQGARKTKTARTVPLSVEAVRLIEQVRGVNPDRVFGLMPASLDTLFRKAKARALVEGLHFHDSRREALTRMAAKVDVLTLAKISGHKDLRILSNVYYAPDMGDVADRLG